MKYEMTKDLETGNAMIDKEHKELFDAVNRLLDSCSKGQGRAAMDGAIQFLVNYVDKHFANEERLQQSKNYPGMAAHKVFHANYKKELRQIANHISTEGPSMTNLGKLNGHVAVLLNHILYEDKKLSAFLKQA